MKDLPVSWSSPSEHFSLPADEVHVWRARLDLDARRVEVLLDLLSPDERERADRFHLPTHRQRFIVGRGLLRTLLGRYLATEPAELRFGYGPFGKPFLADASSADGLRFNVAHSHDLALFAVTRNREIGVDLEHMRPIPINDEVAERFFSPNEVAAIRALPAGLQMEGFYNCWSRKEAYLKAKGKGLVLPLNGFDVTLAPGEPARLLATLGEPEEASRWRLQELPVGTGFSAALAVEGSNWRLCCWEWPASSGE